MPLDLGLEVPEKPKEEKKETKPITDDEAKTMIDRAENREYSSFMCCLVVGQDDTGKTGIVMDYCSNLPKKTLVLDLDLGSYEVKSTYHKEDKNIIIPNDIMVMEKTEKDIVINYEKTITNLKALVKYVKDHHNEYSAIIVDGISTLLKYAEYIMRIDKSIAPDGGVQLRYWIQRNKTFIEFLEAVKSVTGVDKFFIGHEDFIVGDEAASVKVKTNQMIHQRIICKKIKEQGADKKPTGNILYTATIDKSKYNLKKQGKEYTFATVPKEGEPTWNIKGIFEGLK